VGDHRPDICGSKEKPRRSGAEFRSAPGQMRLGRSGNASWINASMFLAPLTSATVTPLPSALFKIRGRYQFNDARPQPRWGIQANCPREPAPKAKNYELPYPSVVRGLGRRRPQDRKPETWLLSD
jgi:hypothetical protein